MVTCRKINPLTNSESECLIGRCAFLAKLSVFSATMAHFQRTFYIQISVLFHGLCKSRFPSTGVTRIAMKNESAFRYGPFFTKRWSERNIYESFYCLPATKSNVIRRPMQANRTVFVGQNQQ